MNEDLPLSVSLCATDLLSNQSLLLGSEMETGPPSLHLYILILQCPCSCV